MRIDFLNGTVLSVPAKKPNFYYVRQSAVIVDSLNKSLFWREEKICDELSDVYSVELLYSNFDHYTKKKRKPFQCGKPYSLKGFSTPGYQTHTGLARVFDALVFTVRVCCYLLFNTSRGDKVIFAMPTPAPILISRLLRVKGVDVFYDLRDAWPDAIVDVNSILYPIFYFYIKTVFLIADINRSLCLSMSDTLAYYYSRKYRLQLTSLRTVVLRRGVYHPNCTDIEGGAHRTKNISLREKKYIFFAGSLVNQFDWDMAFDLISKVPNDYDVVIAGDGPLREELIKRAKDIENLKFIGRISPDEVRLLSLQSFFNFCFYAGEEFKGHITNKVLEYAESDQPMVHNLGSFFVNRKQIKLGIELNRVVDFCELNLKISECNWEAERKAFFHVCANSRMQEILYDSV